MLAGTKVEAIDDSGGQGQGHRLTDCWRREQRLETDKVLQAIGFAARTEGYGLDTTLA